MERNSVTDALGVTGAVQVAMLLDSQKGYFRRHAESHRQNAGTDARRHKEMATVFDDVADRIALAVARWNDRAPDEGKHHLSSVGMARDCQRNPGRDRWEEGGIVGDGDDWR